MKKNFFIIIFFLFSLTQKSYGYSSDPKQFITEIVDEAKKILVDSNSKEFKTKNFANYLFEKLYFQDFFENCFLLIGLQEL